MERISNNLMVCWLIACALHLPFPVWDGDNIGRSNLGTLGCCMHNGRDATLFSDLDFVFLGCDPPDDVDDGPVDADPENGSGPFGAVPMLHYDRESRLMDYGIPGGMASQDLTCCSLRCEDQEGCFCRTSASSSPCRSVRSGHRHPVVIRC